MMKFCVSAPAGGDSYGAAASNGGAGGAYPSSGPAPTPAGGGAYPAPGPAPAPAGGGYGGEALTTLSSTIKTVSNLHRSVFLTGKCFFGKHF